MLIADENIRPISAQAMENAEISLITHLIIPKNIYERTYELTKTELAIDPQIDDVDEILEFIKSKGKKRKSIDPLIFEDKCDNK